MKVVNFTLDYDGKLLLLLAPGEYLIKVDTNFSSAETIYLPKRIFQPKKVLANFSFLFIANAQQIFIYDRRERNFQKIIHLRNILPFGLSGGQARPSELLDFSLAPSGEVVLARRGEGRLIKLDLFFNPVEFTSLRIDFLPQSLAFQGDDLYLLNQRKSRIEVYNRLGLLIDSFPLLTFSKDMRFFPNQPKDALYLFSQKGRLFILNEGKFSSVAQTIEDLNGQILSALRQNRSFFILTSDGKIYKITN